MDEDVKREIELALIKRAKGYDAMETIEEFALGDGEEKLCRKKVTTKNFPPDVSAAKLLLALDGGKDLALLSDEELEEEKNKLYKILEDIKKDENYNDR